MQTLNITGSDFFATADDIPADMLQDLMDCGGCGDATESVEYFLENYGDRIICDNPKKYLESYGAWNEEDLSDNEANVKRVIWIIACNLVESGEAYLSTY